MNRDHVVELPGLNTSKPYGVDSRLGCKHGEAPQAECTGRFSRRRGITEELAGEGGQSRGLCYIYSASSTQTPAMVTLPGH